MSRSISPCTYGGGDSCKRQGGSGAAAHACGYTHPYPTTAETGVPPGDPVEPVQKSEVRTVRMDEIQHTFDEDLSKAILDTFVHQGVDVVDMVRKSMYDFDLDSDEGVKKLLGLLPIMDVTILEDVAGEIWPGYPAQEQPADLLRWEVRGYLMDWLDGHGQEEDSSSGPADVAGVVEEGAPDAPAASQ